MDRYVASEAQATAFVDNLVKGIITGQVPFQFIENDFVKAAGRAVGFDLPSAKALAAPLLDKILAEQHTFTSTMLQDIDYLGGTSDGWRKRYCQSGASMMNFIALPGSRAVDPHSTRFHAIKIRCNFLHFFQALGHAKPALYMVPDARCYRVLSACFA
jgi:hypothetical protein